MMRLVGLGALALLLAQAPVRAEDAPTPDVATASGPVRGLVGDGVARFLGIPFAAAPVGALRWQPPQPPPHWSAPLEANHVGAVCPAGPRGVFASPSETEDCLFLNLFAPATAGARAALPVMVWIHGGGLYSGSGNDYDGSWLARRGQVIVVTFNYRVGALGFFSHPAINAEGHAFANYGIMDQQAALRWVRDNIARFGGDPARVTIFGQSGGGTSVMANLVSPASKGLFTRAINQSGTHIEIYPPEVALKAAADFASQAGCADQSAACLRGLDVRAVLAHQGGIVKNLVNGFPVVDGTIIPRTAFAAFRSGKFNQVPILTGLVADEQAFFLPEATGGAPLDADAYRAHVRSFGAAAQGRLLARYPLDAYASPSLADIAFAQGYKACVSRQLDLAFARFVPVYVYQFDDRTAPTYFPPLSYPMRAYHTAELQYLFAGFHGGLGTPHPLDAAQQRLSDTMLDYWAGFARAGSPNAAALPRWPRFAAGSETVTLLDRGVPRTQTGLGAHNGCALWDQVQSSR